MSCRIGSDKIFYVAAAMRRTVRNGADGSLLGGQVLDNQVLDSERGRKNMKYIKGAAVIWGATMAGEWLHHWLPLPVPAGVYGLFLLLLLLCTGLVKENTVAGAGGLLLELMPLMFIPAGAGLMANGAELAGIWFPLTVISVVSTVFVMVVSGWTAQAVLLRKRQRMGARKPREKENREVDDHE